MRGTQDGSPSAFNLACVHALRKDWPACRAWLREAIDVDAHWADAARTDDDLAEARRRPEIAELIERR